MMNPDQPGLVTRPVFNVSDGTGITAETIGHSLLTQFTGFRFQTDRISFVDDEEKARDAADRIRRAGSTQELTTIGRAPSATPARRMRSAASRAFSSSSTKEMRSVWKRKPVNCVNRL